MFQCQVCGIRMQFQQNYLHHVQTGQALQCVNCLGAFDSLCALRSHRQLVHPREFEESRRMMQDADIAAKLCPHQASSNNTGDSEPNNKMGNAISSPRPGKTGSIFVKTDGTENRESMKESGFQQWGCPQGGNFSIPVLKPDPVHRPKPEIKKGKDLIDLSGPDEERSDLDKAVEALIESIRKRTQQEERSTLVNRTENRMSVDPPSTISDQVKNTGHVDVNSSGRMETAQSELSTYKEECENTNERLSHGSSVPTRFYTPQSESSVRFKRAKYNGTEPSEGLEVVRAKELSQSTQAPASMQREHSGVRLVCFECEATFSTILGLQHHQIMYEHNYCKICLSFFNDRSLFERHIQLIHSFKCIVCQLTYKSWEEKAEHQRQTGHGYCKECRSYFLDGASYAKHLSLHSCTKFACPICKAGFATEESRDMHQSATKHAYCKECGCYFRDQTSYAKHVDIHKVTAFVCPTCGAGFATEGNRDVHQRETKHAVCPRCDKVFANKASEKSHTGVAHRHKCSTSRCKLAFPTSCLLEAHEAKSHTFCKLCNRTFVDRTALLSHERTSDKHVKKGHI
ncbi:hypothetical protein GX50_04190 [[Emmonsia] crescens]|uniref:C2H2-type domain-containing protein n=1 Tax=[Emmonsia] crescens TaxID=73230 RepID=A0A2B7ZG68_9EURO|nr:hypothetical protein GX50_04190 [Emmonsia crescens]